MRLPPGRALLVLLVCSLVAASVAPAVGVGVAADHGDGSGPHVDGLAYFTTSDPSATPPLEVGFSAGGDGTFFLVAEDADGDVLGHTDGLSFSGSAVDGFEVPTRDNVSGFRRVRVAAYNDTNANGAFDAADTAMNASTGYRQFLFPNRSGVGNVTAEPAVVTGNTSDYRFHVPVERQTTLRQVGLYYRFQVGYGGIEADEVTVSVGDERVEAASLSVRQGVLVANLSQSVEVEQGRPSPSPCPTSARRSAHAETSWSR
ncbi:hypothetical protein [Halospeciosus flavus]|uniref:hypothetical protein n=1 Tax=Halospeciosus flavus TaxID=3032283 RepID=UPI0036244882